jgi:anti-sigma regulatory factor (Ser/Thr protein kinase)
MDRREWGSGCADDLAETPGAGQHANPAANGFSHAALLYSSQAEYLNGIAEFAAAAAAAPIHAAVPASALGLVRQTLPSPLTRGFLGDMDELGRNPARLIAAAQSFAEENPGDQVYCLWEPAWPRRSPSEMREVARHEALCNLAFSGSDITILCLYDASGLGSDDIGHAERTHPFVTAGGQRRASAGYLGPGRFPDGCDGRLPAPADADAFGFTVDLGGVREFAARQAESAGLWPERAADLVLAVSEIAANAIGHATGGGLVRAWSTDTELICQVEDAGHITDPLAGRIRPQEVVGGHGLWVVNKICDLVEQRTGPDGTATRLHVRRPVTRRRPTEA